ncbi:MAG TPA: MFS transporter [Gammaproteobacteria bacterium]|jgi:MFS family permease|nr:MFS transporter [Gammaproteobacteria bacterium]
METIKQTTKCYNKSAAVYLALFASLGGVLIGYDGGIIGSVLLFIQPSLLLNDFMQGLSASIIIFGTIIGALINKIYRQWPQPRCITLAALIYAFGFAIAACASHIVILIIGQFFAGLACGIIFVIVPLYLAEIAPPKSRGAFVTTFQLGITFGILLGYLCSYLVAPYQAWQGLFVCGGMIAIILLLSSFFLPIPLSSIESQRDNHYKSNFKLLFTNNKRCFFIGNGLAVLQQATGINAIIFFAPQIFQSVYPQGNITAIFSGMIIMFGNFLFTFIALFVFDFFGRRPILIFGLLLQCIALTLLGIFEQWSIGYADIFSVFCLLLYVFGFAVGLGPGSWLVISEIYPIDVRERLMGVTIIINNLAAFIVACSFLSLHQFLGAANVFWMYAFVALLGLGLVKFFVPETKLKNLE